MLKYRYRLLRWLVVVFLVVSGTAFVGATSASAAITDWELQLDNVHAATMLTHSSGAVSVGRIAGSNNPSVIQTVNAANSSVTTVPAGASPQAAPNEYMWVVSTDDTIYTPAMAGSQMRLVAYKNGQKVWDIVPPDICANQLEAIHALQLGADGHVYIVSGRFAGCSGFCLKSTAKTGRRCLGNRWGVAWPSGRKTFLRTLAALGCTASRRRGCGSTVTKGRCFPIRPLRSPVESG